MNRDFTLHSSYNKFAMELKLCTIFIFIFFTAATLNLVWATDYCSRDLCRNGKHIACGNSQQFSSSCPQDASIVPITKAQKELILREFNEHRNFIAGGGDANHKPACRMATMQWDDELAQLAALNVKQCVIKHDSCRNTDNFKYAGQNLAKISSSERLNTMAELKRSIQMWYDEVAYSTMSIIRKYPASNNGNVIGHFTVMVADRNTHVGCAASTFSSSSRLNTFLFACNFATTNMINHPIYKDCSRAATNCLTGTNPNYRNLCSLSEVFYVNKWY